MRIIAYLNDIPLGCVEYLIADVHNSHKAKRVFVDERLKNNKYVKIEQTLKLYDEFEKCENVLKIYKNQYDNLYLDIEKEEMRTKISDCVSRCLSFISDMNKDLSPFHWERIEYYGVLCLALIEGTDNNYMSEYIRSYEV